MMIVWLGFERPVPAPPQLRLAQTDFHEHDLAFIDATSYFQKTDVGESVLLKSSELHRKSLDFSEHLDNDLIPNEFTLTFRSAADRRAFERLVLQSGATVLDSIPALHAIRIRVDSKEALRHLLARGPQPRDYASNAIIRISPPSTSAPAEVPSRPYAGFGNNVLGQMGLSIPPSPEQGKGIRIAVLDTGIAEGFGGMITHIQDFTGEGPTESMHGFAVASLISGEHGMVPAAAIMDFKALSDGGTGDSFTLARAIVEATDAGADIINISAGTSADNPILREAIDYANGQGSLIVASAGNDGMPEILYPGNYPGVLTVGGVDARQQHLHFSNTGSSLDLTAPGIGITVSTENEADYFSFSGTSASAPLVAAAAAWLKYEEPTLDNDAIIALLKTYSDDAGQPGHDDTYGAGTLNAGRIEERHEQGIVDMVAIKPFVQKQPEQGIVVIEVYGQNQGTRSIPQVQMHVDVNGQKETLWFQNVVIGATIAHTIEMSLDTVNREGLDITFELHPVGMLDDRPANNAGRMVLLPSES